MLKTKTVRIRASNKDFRQAKERVITAAGEFRYNVAPTSKADVEALLNRYCEYWPNGTIINDTFAVSVPGALVFQPYEGTRWGERPYSVTWLEFVEISGPVVISRPADLASLPDNYEGDLYVRLEKQYSGDWKDENGILELFPSHVAAEMATVVETEKRAPAVAKRMKPRA